MKDFHHPEDGGIPELVHHHHHSTMNPSSQRSHSRSRSRPGTSIGFVTPGQSQSKLLSSPTMGAVRTRSEGSNSSTEANDNDDNRDLPPTPPALPEELGVG